MENWTKKAITVFKAHKNYENADSMSKYMKNLFPYLGIKRPERNELQKQLLSKENIPSLKDLPEVITFLWNQKEREFQYLALDLLKKYQKKYIESHINLFEKLIISKSWWDTVDLLATQMVGEYFKLFPEKISETLPSWITSDDMWLNRAAILFQLKYKNKTNTDLLEKTILPHIHSNEFFHQKAIGWALREYSKTNAKYVLTFVNKHPLKPLSAREATRLTE